MDRSGLRQGGLRQGLSQSQQLSQQMLPRMLQSIEVLQLPSTDLEAFLREAYESNEALRLEEPESPALARPRGTREDTQRHDEMLQNFPARGGGVVQELDDQLALAGLDGEAEAWVRFLVRCLDDCGFLSLGDEHLLELAAEEGLAATPARLGAAIATLQSLEPRGIGARNAIEALLLQLDPQDPDYRLLCRLLEEFLDEVATNKWPRVARAMGIEVTRVRELVDTLRTLNPRPASALAPEAAPPLVPEVVVEPEGMSFAVRVDAGALPAVSLDEEVRALARDASAPKEVRQRLRQRVDEARWIVEAVAQRRATLLRVASTVFARQRGFLEHGPGHLQPLKMSEVAEHLGLHTSTVSRAVAGKYAQTPFGILPLRHFFQSAVGSEAEGGEAAARDDARAVVASIVEGEDPVEPLSDDEIAAEAARRGVSLARRTVAKYRKELGIGSSYRRREYR